MADPLHLLTGADEVFGAGLAAAVASALSATRGAECVMHVIDGGLSASTVERLERLARGHGRATLLVHPLNEGIFEGFKPGAGNSLMYYARLCMGRFVPADRVVYFDADMVLLCRLTDLWKEPLGRDAVAVCADRKVRTLGEDCPWPLTETEKSLPYFNSGFLLVDLERWRREKREEQAFRLSETDPSTYRWHDQTVLNYVFRGQTRFLPETWNWQYEALPTDLSPASLNIHFTSARKPWRHPGPDVRFRVWRRFARASGLSPLGLALADRRDAWPGIWETCVRRCPAVRDLYTRWLQAREAALPASRAAAVRATREFYQSGLGSPAFDGQLRSDHPILREACQRLFTRPRR